MMQNTISGKILKVLSFLILAGQLLGQSAWNTGDLSFDYQTFPTPAQSLNLSGDLISDEVPHAGVGGFELSVGDTNLITLLAYDLYVSDGDTLADIFVILMSDTLPLEAGSYSVNPSPDALKMFVWLSEVDPESLAGLIDASFSLDSLAAFNPYLSVSGEFDIIAMNNFHFEMNFTGVMVNTSIQLRTITNGRFELWNTLPVSVYSHGRLDYNVGEDYGTVIGALNPIIEPEGAGAVQTQSGDTLTYNFISYQELSDNVYDVYGVILVGDESHFPLDGSITEFNISLLSNELPRAVPYMIQDISLDEIILLLESGNVPDLDQFTQLYLPIGMGSAVFGYTPEGNAELTVGHVLMTNTSADITTLNTQWYLSNSPVVSIDNQSFDSPSSRNLVGYAYPNPFNSSTRIPIQLFTGQDISARFYNLRGQEVYTLEFGYLGPGQQQLAIDLRDSNLGGGLYYYSIFSRESHVGSGSFIYLK